MKDPELEFEFFLAEKLHMTVSEMRTKMDEEEFHYWNIYFARKQQQQELQDKLAMSRGRSN